MIPRVTDVQWLALTVYQEAGAEPYLGKVAVAHIVRNRMRATGRSLPDVIFEPYQFSAWNTESPTRSRLDTIGSVAWADCSGIAEKVLDGTLLDVTDGATHYLNEEATRRGRPHSDLPAWFDESKVTARIGRHTFLKI